jgi:xanthine dehydrogenase accessory factor
MSELHSILQAWRDQQDAGRAAVLATVVHVMGSAYRRPGSRMIVLPDGRHIGGISGGCLEGEVVKRAWWFTESDTPVVRIYDTSSDDDAVWEFGLGCNGIVHVLLERTTSRGAARLMQFLDLHRRNRIPAVIATVIHSIDPRIRIGDRLLTGETSTPAGELVEVDYAKQLRNEVSSVFAERSSRLVHLHHLDVFVEFIAPPQSLVIFGAGHDAIPLVEIGSQLGWEITVADGRPGYAKAERFLSAERVVTMHTDDLLADIHIDEHSAVVVMTHNFPMDLRLLPLLLARRPRYLGILGPRTRADRLFAQLDIPAPCEVHAPAGLDIGCDTPAAIALSIAADIQASLSGRAGGSLMLREGAIHAPAVEIGNASETTMQHRLRPSYCETLVESNV